EEGLRAAGAERDRLLESERTARAEAERANRIKDDFVATVSHELRTPLNAIVGWNALLKSGPRDAAMLDRVADVIGRNTRVLTQLVSDLLDISRIVAGKIRLDLQPVDLTTVVESALQAI